jgi:hypothetical protein
MDAVDPVARVRELVDGVRTGTAVSVAASLGLSDLLRDGPRTTAQLAEATATHEPTLRRLLRALATLDVYAREDEDRWRLTEVGVLLCRGGGPSYGAWAELSGRPYMLAAWAALADSVRTGGNAFRAVHGESIWSYRARHPDEQEVFDRAMSGLAGAVTAAVCEAHDFGRYGSVADVGGGRGALLAALLTRWPSLRGVLVDQPAVVDSAAALLADAGVADRCRTVGADFFDAVPSGSDAYVLKAVLHDWEDDACRAVLGVVRRAVPADGVLLVVEQLLDEGPDPRRTAFMDLNMLVAPGGRERTRDEYAALLAASGFALTQVQPTRSDVFVLVATPR